MIKGIGVDVVDISEIGRFLELHHHSGAFQKRTFTKAEQVIGEQQLDPAVYYATRFAAKEAVFKAVAHLTVQKWFDMRSVETLNNEDGFPYINITDDMRKVFEEAGLTNVQITLTTEGDVATAFVVALGK